MIFELLISGVFKGTAEYYSNTEHGPCYSVFSRLTTLTGFFGGLVAPNCGFVILCFMVFPVPEAPERFGCWLGVPVPFSTPAGHVEGLGSLRFVWGCSAWCLSSFPRWDSAGRDDVLDVYK